MSKKESMAGKKIATSHSSLIPAAVPIVKQLQGLLVVRKIILGPIRQAARGKKRVALREVDAGLRLTVRMRGRVQTLWVYTDDTVRVTAALTRAGFLSG